MTSDSSPLAAPHTLPSSPHSPLTEEAFQRASLLRHQRSIPSDEESAEITKQRDIKRKFLLYLQSLHSSSPQPQSLVSHNQGCSAPVLSSELGPSGGHIDGSQTDQSVQAQVKEKSSLLGVRGSTPSSGLEPKIRKRSLKRKARQGKKGVRKTYCLCKRPDANEFMVRCDGRCKNWYHPVCLGLKESLVMMECANEPTKKFLCWDCQDVQAEKTATAL